MTRHAQIKEIDPTDLRLEGLAAEARSEGYEFMDRLLAEARAGVNCFDKKGEVFCGALLSNELVGCGGVNLDPYADQEVGRLRHVFVSRQFRRKGVATALVHRLLQTSKSRFSIVRLRTSDERADRFYETFGFSQTSEEAATHVIRI